MGLSPVEVTRAIVTMSLLTTLVVGLILWHIG